MLAEQLLIIVRNPKELSPSYTFPINLDLSLENIDRFLISYYQNKVYDFINSKSTKLSPSKFTFIKNIAFINKIDKNQNKNSITFTFGYKTNSKVIEKVLRHVEHVAGRLLLLGSEQTTQVINFQVVENLNSEKNSIIEFININEEGQKSFPNIILDHKELSKFNSEKLVNLINNNYGFTYDENLYIPFEKLEGYYAGEYDNSEDFYLDLDL